MLHLAFSFTDNIINNTAEIILLKQESIISYMNLSKANDCTIIHFQTSVRILRKLSAQGPSHHPSIETDLDTPFLTSCKSETRVIIFKIASCFAEILICVCLEKFGNMTSWRRVRFSWFVSLVSNYV